MKNREIVDSVDLLNTAVEMREVLINHYNESKRNKAPFEMVALNKDNVDSIKRIIRNLDRLEYLLSQ